MGSSSSKLVDAEKTSWVLPHKLNYDDGQRDEQIRLLRNFGQHLKLCYDDREIYPLKYQHWWITDGRWILEFGGGDILNNSVIVHCNPRTTYTVDQEFEKDEDVLHRMQSICGATNYSLALRNCEHVARYIHCGAWICFQMVGDGVLQKSFFQYMSTFTKLINTFPEELKPDEVSKSPLYPDAPINMITFRKIKDALTKTDKRAYTIVFLGPTGSGKSHLINNLFNLSVCATASTAHSVTREVQFYHGSYSWPMGPDGFHCGPVNIIDTLGFCDSRMSPESVLDAIKSSVEVNLAYIDKVVIVCSGRIEKAHSDSIKDFMHWLSFSNYKDKFVFIYNKADLHSAQERMTNLLSMCSIFGANQEKPGEMNDGKQFFSIKMNQATGFPPGASFAEIKRDHTEFTQAILCRTDSRIPVDKSICTIL